MNLSEFHHKMSQLHRLASTKILFPLQMLSCHIESLHKQHFSGSRHPVGSSGPVVWLKTPYPPLSKIVNGHTET